MSEKLNWDRIRKMLDVMTDREELARKMHEPERFVTCTLCGSFSTASARALREHYETLHAMPPEEKP